MLLVLTPTLPLTWLYPGSVGEAFPQDGSFWVQAFLEEGSSKCKAVLPALGSFQVSPGLAPALEAAGKLEEELCCSSAPRVGGLWTLLLLCSLSGTRRGQGRGRTSSGTWKGLEA